MNKFFQLSQQDKIEIINQIVIHKKLPAEAIEKDIWVTAVLQALFALPYAKELSFKGGTSLSKCWNLIERFSEDVDIAVNREHFGFQGDVFTIKQISKDLRKACCKFSRNTLQFDFSKQMIAEGIPKESFEVTMDISDVTTVDPEKIFVKYNSLFANNLNNNTENYIKPDVILEISGRSMKEPLESVEVKSFVDEVFADKTFANKPFNVQTVVPERTFFEKMCLLHEEFSKQAESIRVDRMSRHLYDLARMMDSEVAQNALNNTELYKSIITHRRMFIAIKDFDYDTLSPATINIIPPQNVIAQWEEDYNKMQTMIYGKSLPFSELIGKIKQLNQKINSIRLN